MKSIKEKSKEYADEQDLRTWKYIVDAVWTEKEGIGQYLDSPFTEEVAKKLQKRFGNIKQSWSEEDERMYTATIFALAGFMGNEDKIDWLKSLKERYTWKPSDEQIKVCKEVYADILSAKGFDLGTINSELNRLEEDLKKLKG